MNLTELKETLRQFAHERDWNQFHTPKNLCMALGGEAGELLELYQWLDTQADVKADQDLMKKTAEELADIMIYAIRMADILDIDIQRSIKDKISQNARKYPIEKSKGSAKKYTEL